MTCISEATYDSIVSISAFPARSSYWQTNHSASRPCPNVGHAQAPADAVIRSSFVAITLVIDDACNWARTSMRVRRRSAATGSKTSPRICIQVIRKRMIPNLSVGRSTEVYTLLFLTTRWPVVATISSHTEAIRGHQEEAERCHAHIRGSVFFEEEIVCKPRPCDALITS